MLLLSTSLLYAQDRVDQIREKIQNKQSTEVLVVSHRAGWRAAPENSIPAILESIRIGVDIIELDVQVSKDGHLILMHDETLDRTTTGTGKVGDWTLDSLRTLKLRNGGGIRTKYGIPTLEEALLASKGKIMVNLDKAYGIFDQIYELTERTGTSRQIIMKGTQSPAQVQADFGPYLKDILYMPIVDLDKPGALDLIQNFQQTLNPFGFELLYSSDQNPLPKTLVPILQGKHLIWYNTLWDTMAGGHDDAMSWDNVDLGFGYLIDSLGARMLQTDRPQLLIDYLNSRGN